MISCETCKPLLSGLIDNELTPQERQDVVGHLGRCESCRQEQQQLIGADQKLQYLSFEEPDEAVYRKFWFNPVTRLMRFSALFFIIGGWGCLTVYGLYEFISNPNEPFVPKIGTAAMIIGGVLLFLVVLINRIRTYSNDPYKEVER